MARGGSNAPYGRERTIACGQRRLRQSRDGMGLEEDFAMRHFAIVTVLVVGGFARAAAFAQVGACCSGDGSCSDTNLAGCDLGPGEFLGEGTTCATTVCLGA